MNEHFLRLYNDELAALRQQSLKFADAYPEVAGRLRLSADVADDPQTEHLLQSFAYSAARIRFKLDDEFPELTNELLEILYPHFLTTTPSMTIVKFEPDHKLDRIQAIPRFTEIVTDPIEGDICRFRTTQQVDIAPIKISNVTLTSQPTTAPRAAFVGASACLRISLEPLDTRNSFQNIGLKKIKFYITAPWIHAISLYELLGNNVLGIALARHPHDEMAIFLNKENLQLTGFEDEENILPYPATSFTGYRLLTEFFALPQKFMFFEINGLQRPFEKRLDIFIYLKSSDTQLEKAISSNSLALYVTPIINIFPQICEPLDVDGTHSEYVVIPDMRRLRSREILSIEAVSLVEKNGRRHVCQPLFRQCQTESPPTIFWQGKRNKYVVGDIHNTKISFVDADWQPIHLPPMVASVNALCSNGDLPKQLPFGGGNPHLKTTTSFGITSVKQILPMTMPMRRLDEGKQQWSLISHLSLNHASLGDNNGAVIKEILRLYVVGDPHEKNRLIDAITALTIKNSSTRLDGGTFVSGTDVLMEFDAALISKASAFQFGSIIERFLGVYTSINTYTQLTVKLRGVEQAVAVWPPRLAERPLI